MNVRIWELLFKSVHDIDIEWIMMQSIMLSSLLENVVKFCIGQTHIVYSSHKVTSNSYAKISYMYTEAKVCMQAA